MAGPATVTVYLKYPSGINLRMHDFHNESELMMGGMSRDVRVARFNGRSFVLNGTAAPFGQARRDANGEFVRMVAGYAITEGVPKDMWDQWLEQNKDHNLVRNKLIYAHEKTGEGDAWAKDHKTTLSGLEPLVQTLADGAGRITQHDPRAPRSPVRDERPQEA